MKIHNFLGNLAIKEKMFVFVLSNVEKTFHLNNRGQHPHSVPGRHRVGTTCLWVFANWCLPSTLTDHFAKTADTSLRLNWH